MSEETTGDLSAYELTIDITNRIYNNALLKPDSEDYKTLSSQLHGVVRFFYLFIFQYLHDLFFMIFLSFRKWMRHNDAWSNN